MWNNWKKRRKKEKKPEYPKLSKLNNQHNVEIKSQAQVHVFELNFEGPITLDEVN